MENLEQNAIVPGGTIQPITKRSRRYKTLFVDPEDVLALITGFGRHGDYVQFPSICGLPEDVVVDGVDYAPHERAFVFRLWSETFEEVPAGEWVPRYEGPAGHRVETVNVQSVPGLAVRKLSPKAGDIIVYRHPTGMDERAKSWLANAINNLHGKYPDVTFVTFVVMSSALDMGRVDKETYREWQRKDLEEAVAQPLDRVRLDMEVAYREHTFTFNGTVTEEMCEQLASVAAESDRVRLEKERQEREQKQVLDEIAAHICGTMSPGEKAFADEYIEKIIKPREEYRENVGAAMGTILEETIATASDDVVRVSMERAAREINSDLGRAMVDEKPPSEGDEMMAFFKGPAGPGGDTP